MCTVTLGLFCVNLANIFVHWPKLTTVKAKVSPSRKQLHPVTLKLCGENRNSTWPSRITFSVVTITRKWQEHWLDTVPRASALPSEACRISDPNVVQTHAEAVGYSQAIYIELFRVQRTGRLSQKALVHAWKESNTSILKVKSFRELKYQNISVWRGRARFSQQNWKGAPLSLCGLTGP